MKTNIPAKTVIQCDRCKKEGEDGYQFAQVAVAQEHCETERFDLCNACVVGLDQFIADAPTPTDRALAPPRCPSTAKAGEWIRNKATGETRQVVNSVEPSAFQPGRFCVLLRDDKFMTEPLAEWEIVEPAQAAPEDGPCEAEARADKSRWPQVGDVAVSPDGERSRVDNVIGTNTIEIRGTWPSWRALLANGWRFEPEPKETA